MSFEQPDESKNEAVAGASSVKEHSGAASEDFGPATPEELAAQGELDLGGDPSALYDDAAEFHRDPTEEVDVEHERERVSARLEGVRELKKEKQKKAEAGDKDSAAHVKGLEKAEKELEDDLKRIETAEVSNEGLSELAHLKESDAESFESFAKTGKDKHGNKLKGKHGKPLELNSAQTRRLAELAGKGISHVTWEHLSTIYEVADALLHEVTSAFKRFVRIKR